MISIVETADGVTVAEQPLIKKGKPTPFLVGAVIAELACDALIAVLLAKTVFSKK